MIIHKHSNSKHLFIDLLTRVLESTPRPRSAVVLNTVRVASFSGEASPCKQLVKLGLRIALDYGHSKCRDSDTSEGLTGRSTRIAVLELFHAHHLDMMWHHCMVCRLLS